MKDKAFLGAFHSLFRLERGCRKVLFCASWLGPSSLCSQQQSSFALFLQLPKYCMCSIQANGKELSGYSNRSQASSFVRMLGSLLRVEVNLSGDNDTSCFSCLQALIFAHPPGAWLVDLSSSTSSHNRRLCEKLVQLQRSKAGWWYLVCHNLFLCYSSFLLPLLQWRVLQIQELHGRFCNNIPLPFCALVMCTLLPSITILGAV